MCSGFSVNSVADSSVSDNNAPILTTSFTPHAYFGARAGWADFQDACTQNQERCDNDTFGYGIYLGYQVKSWLALEGGLTDYGKPSSHYDIGDISARVKGGELATKLSYPIFNNIDLFTRIGAAYQRIDKKQTSSFPDRQKVSYWSALGAVGIDYRVSSKWSLRSEYQFIDGIGNSNVDHADLHFLSFGVSYHFGQSAVEKNSAYQSDSEEAFVSGRQTTTEPEVVTLSAESLFKFDSVKLKDINMLKPLANELTYHNSGNIYVVGHTDNTGSEKYNMELSLLRAQSVAEYLKHMGIDASRLIVRGEGEKQPIASNDTEQGRKKNRRVEVQYNFRAEDAAKSVVIGK